MPRFFDPNHLTEAQQARWTSAVSEYDRVVTANIDRRLAEMTPAELECSRAFYGVPADAPIEALKEKMKAAQPVLGGGAGDAKSALFARLLDGKSPLPYPPPTSYAYPWYGVIEDKGPFPVMVSFVEREGRTPEAQRTLSEHELMINGCYWTIVGTNRAAGRLIQLQRQLKRGEPDENGLPGRVHGWTPDFLAEVRETYAAGPTFYVKHGRWSNYRLTLGRRHCFAQRGYIEELIHNLAVGEGVTLSNLVSVLDAWRLCMNFEVGDVSVKGEHPRQRLERLKADPSLQGGPAELFARAQESAVESDSAEYEADPDKFDSVHIVGDDWVLEKTVLMAPFSPDEVQRLNEWQTQTNPGLKGHPFTCPNRYDTPHRQAGGDLGILIATEDGWVCPDCDYTQDWAHLLMGMPPEPDKESNFVERILGTHPSQVLPDHLKAYETLAREGAKGADVMVASLRARQAQLEQGQHPTPKGE